MGSGRRKATPSRVSPAIAKESKMAREKEDSYRKGCL